MPADLDPLQPGDLELIAAADRVVRAHGHPERHSVAAAVRDRAGGVHLGLNLYHFTGGPCAELVALGAARTAGAYDLDAIVAVGDEDRGVLGPCGRDRQVFVDLYPGLRVVVPTPDGPRSTPATTLLPYAYGALDADGAVVPPGRHTAAPELRFHRDHLDLVLAGRKTTTVRFRDPVTTGPVRLVFETEDPVVLPGTVSLTRAARVADLTDEDGRADGFADRAELLDRLRYHYPDLAADDTVTVVTFAADG